MPVCDNTSSYDSPDDFERKDDSNVANWQGNPIRSNVGPPGNQPVVTPVNPPAQFRKHRSFDTDHVAQNESIDGSNPKGVARIPGQEGSTTDPTYGSAAKLDSIGVPASLPRPPNPAQTLSANWQTPNPYDLWRPSASYPYNNADSPEKGHDDGVVRTHGISSKRGRVDNHDHKSTGRSNAEHSQVKLCVVCEKNPQYSNGRKRYPTCGLTCAAELESRNNGSKPMCLVCGVRPMHFPYCTCGFTCAAKLESRDVSHDPLGEKGHQRQDMDAVSPSITYSSCLMCWRASQQSGSEFCGSRCASAAEGQAVLLLEAPQGHVTFQSVSQHFQDTWQTSAPCPEVLKVYKIVEKHASVVSYEKYRTKIHANDQHQTSQGNESRRWYGTSRECDLGDPDNESLCSSLTCLLCSIIQNSFDVSKSVNGIHTSATSSQSDIHSESTGKSPRKTMLLTNVSSGKEIELMRDEVRHERPFDYDSVRVIDRSNNGQVSSRDDLIVYTKDAIMPLYLVVYGSF